MDIVKVYQPFDEDMDGRKNYFPEFYLDKEEARKRCNSIGKVFQLEPKEHLALQMKPGEVYLFVSSEPTPVFNTTEEMKKKRALEKLTPEERKLLGHG